MRLKTTDMGEKTLAQKIQTTYAAKIDKNAVNMVMDMLSKLYNDPMNAAIIMLQATTPTYGKTHLNALKTQGLPTSLC